MVYITSSNNKVGTSSRFAVKNYERNIHNSLKFFLVVSQCLGILPQENITKTYSDLKFKWKSWRVVYTLAMVLITSFAVLTCFLNWFYVGYQFSDLGIHFFYSASALTVFLYFRLSRSWPKLMKLWCRMDKIMNVSYGYPDGLDTRLRIFLVIFIVLGLSDYSLGVWSRHVRLTKKFGIEYDYEQFYLDTFPQLYNFVPLNIATAGYCSMMTVHASLMWAFNDLFIIIMSIALALRFRQVTQKIARRFNRADSLQFWTDIREDYDRLCILCKELDDHISYIVLLSYTLNIFFLLNHLYNSMKGVSGIVESIYFIFSFAYLIVKVGSVSLYGAWINDESLEPASALDMVPSGSYNIEIKRLLTQINFDNVALTGCKMFKVTRGIILSVGWPSAEIVLSRTFLLLAGCSYRWLVRSYFAIYKWTYMIATIIAGAVVTYELILIQFNSATNDTD